MDINTDKSSSCQQALELELELNENNLLHPNKALVKLPTLDQIIENNKRNEEYEQLWLNVARDYENYKPIGRTYNQYYPWYV